MRRNRARDALRNEVNINDQNNVQNNIAPQLNHEPVLNMEAEGGREPNGEENLLNGNVDDDDNDYEPNQRNNDDRPEERNIMFADALLDQQQDNAAHEEGEMPALTVGPKDIQADENLEQNILPNLERTKFEVLLMILNFGMRHGLTAVAIEDLCSMVNLILGGNVIPTSRYLFKKIFSSDLEPKFHMYCNSCLSYIGEITRDLRNLKNVPCPVCRKQCNVPGLQGKDFFVTLPVKTQIADLLQYMDHVMENLNFRWERNPSDEIHDVFDGKIYKDLCQEGQFLSHRSNLSLTFSTDGASVFGSGCTTMWPIFFRLNELPPNIRFDESNSMIAALWFGTREPSMSMYFKTFLHECKELYDSGIFWKAPDGEIINSKVITLNCVLDSVAKPMLQCIKKFNGFNSCPYCYHPGVTFGDNVMAKWPMPENDLALLCNLGFVYSIEKYSTARHRFLSYQVGDRRNDGMREDMITAEGRRGVLAQSQYCRGLKGVSPMCYLPFFDVCHGFQIDYMHAVLLGTCKHLASLWFDASSHRPDYKIRNSIDDVDERLLSIKPPSSISRRPRFLKQRVDWHANEWRSWLLYYSLPCLKGILPPAYFKHHCILVSSIFTLLQDSLSKADMERATWELGIYVVEFQKFYTVEDMYFNVHLLLHLGKSVSLWGPLWCYSMFSFESSNNSLIKLVKGTTGVASQIVSKYSVCRFVPHLLKVYEIGEPVVKYCSDLMCFSRFANTTVVNDITLIGYQKFIQLTNEESRAFATYDIPNTGTFYERMIQNKILYNARLYSRKGTRSDDSVVQLNDGSYAAILRIILRPNDEVLRLLRGINVLRAFITMHACGSKAKHIKVCCPVVYGNLFFTNAKNIRAKSIFMSCGATTYISDFPNLVEKD